VLFDVVDGKRSRGFWVLQYEWRRPHSAFFVWSADTGASTVRQVFETAKHVILVVGRVTCPGLKIRRSTTDARRNDPEESKSPSHHKEGYDESGLGRLTFVSTRLVLSCDVCQASTVVI
jgi:hypothetical protein